VHLAEGEESAGGGGWAGGWIWSLRGEQGGNEQEDELGGQRESPDGQGGSDFLQGRFHVYIEYREGAGSLPANSSQRTVSPDR